MTLRAPRRARSLLAALPLAIAVFAPTPAVARPLVDDVREAAAAPTPTSLADGSVRLMAVGDVMLGWEVGKMIQRRSPAAPWRRIAPQLAEADLLVANLECVISTRGEPWPSKRIHLRAPLAAADSLAHAGVDVVSIANNHTLDFGVEAFTDTIDALDAAGVWHAGGGRDTSSANQPAIVDINGLRIAFLGYVLPFSSRPSFNTLEFAARPSRPGVAIGSPDAVRLGVTRWREHADLVVVMVHGGVEYRANPNRAQREFAEAAIDAGASLVLGHHPHVLQGYTRRGNTVVAYSLGNFVFSRFRGASNDSVILDVTITADGVASVNWIPVVIDGGIPRPAVGAEIDRIMARLPPLN